MLSLDDDLFLRCADFERAFARCGLLAPCLTLHSISWRCQPVAVCSYPERPAIRPCHMLGLPANVLSMLEKGPSQGVDPCSVTAAQMASAPGAGGELLPAAVQRGRRSAAGHAQGEGRHLPVRCHESNRT